MRGRLRKGSSSSSEEPVINITPLIDVVFVILIAFIMIAPLLQKEGVELAHAGHAATQLVQPAPVDLQIRVTRDDTILIQGRPVRKEQLSPTLRTLFQRFPKKKPQVFFDKKSSFGTYHFLKDALETSGFQEMEVVLAP